MWRRRCPKYTHLYGITRKWWTSSCHLHSGSQSRSLTPPRHLVPTEQNKYLRLSWNISSHEKRNPTFRLWEWNASTRTWIHYDRLMQRNLQLRRSGNIEFNIWYFHVQRVNKKFPSNSKWINKTNFHRTRVSVQHKMDWVSWEQRRLAAHIRSSFEFNRCWCFDGALIFLTKTFVCNKESTWLVHTVTWHSVRPCSILP